MSAPVAPAAPAGPAAVSSGPGPALVVESVRKEFRVRGGTKVAVADCSFTVDPGRTLAVVGESGAGKSTLAKVIAGLEPPTRGRVLVNGQPLVTRGGQASPV